MQLFKTLPNIDNMKKVIIIGGIFFAAGIFPKAYAENTTLAAVPKLELSQYLGLWYEVARKPMYF